jgi:hypothetical protein
VWIESWYSAKIDLGGSSIDRQTEDGSVQTQLDTAMGSAFIQRISIDSFRSIFLRKWSRVCKGQTK